MIADAGFVVEGSDEKTLARDREQAAADLTGDTGLTADGGLTAGADLPEQLSDRRRDLVSVRRRGAGTDLPPNA
jgi:biotin synthase